MFVPHRNDLTSSIRFPLHSAFWFTQNPPTPKKLGQIWFEDAHLFTASSGLEKSSRGHDDDDDDDEDDEDDEDDDDDGFLGLGTPNVCQEPDMNCYRFGLPLSEGRLRSRGESTLEPILLRNVGISKPNSP